MRTLRKEITACMDAEVRAVEPDRSYELVFRFSDGFMGFQGHFPGHAILPAFVQLLMGQCAVNMRTASHWSLRKVERGKFLKTIEPNQPVTVRWQEQPGAGTLRCTFTLLVDGEKAAVFTAEFASEEDHHA